MNTIEVLNLAKVDRNSRCCLKVGKLSLAQAIVRPAHFAFFP